MSLHTTFSTYVGRQFLFWFVCVFLSLVLLIFLFDFIELLRRTSTKSGVDFTTVLTIALFKLPHMAEKSIPFAVLFGSMMVFWRLNRHHELVVARASGISVWQFLGPVLVVAAFLGILKITLFSPFSSAMLLRYERMEVQFVEGRPSLATVSSEGLWLRQTDEAGSYVLHAEKISPQQMKLDKVIVFEFVGKDKFIHRIDAEWAQLQPRTWNLNKVRISSPNQVVVTRDSHTLPTVLTRENIQDSFTTPETMSFWTLPAFIRVLEKAGFSGLRHRLYWHSQLAVPLLLCAMALLAAAFTLQPIRQGGAIRVISLGIASGFLLYFATDVVYALGLSSRLPAILAAWSPAFISSLLGTALLFHFEDG